MMRKTMCRSHKGILFRPLGEFWHRSWSVGPPWLPTQVRSRRQLSTPALSP